MFRIRIWLRKVIVNGQLKKETARDKHVSPIHTIKMRKESS